MKTTTMLFAELAALDIRLWVENGALRYSAPKGAMTSELRARIAQEKQNLLTLLTQGELDQIPVQPRGQGGLPLSTAQQRFWFLDRLDRGNSASFVMPPIVLHLEGKLDVAALQIALNCVVQRHEVLRTAFRIEADQPVQMPLPSIALVMPIQEIAAENVTEVVHEQALTPFDLDRGEVLMRARLLKLADTTHIFILTLHHIIADGWSMGILIRELAHFYRQQQDDLPPLPIQYADYACWERQRISGPLLERQRDYWQRQLTGAPTLLQLPTDYPRPRVRSNRGQVEHFRLDQTISTALNQLSRQMGVTPFMTLLAVYGVLLCRYTDVEDLVIGSPIAVRTHSQTEALIGLFLNTLALRLDLSGNPSFTELLNRVRNTTLAAFEHREMPFDLVLQGLDLERNLDHTPLFQVLFALQNAPMAPIALEGLQITQQPTASLHAPFDLVLSMEEDTAGYVGFFRYNTDLFAAATIVRLTGHFQNLLTGLVTVPTTPIREQPLLSDAEVQQLATWRGGNAHYPVTDTLHTRFQRQAQTQPEAVAVRCEERILRYGELDTRSDQVARQLIHVGVVPGDRVGLCAERSPELLIGLIAILKVGAAYIPLDPSYPVARLNYMVTDSNLTVVLVHGVTPEIAVTCVELTACAAQADIDTPIPVWHDPETIAYVIYTSGSTGNPKGVAVSHANVLRLFAGCDDDYRFSQEDVWTLFHSYAFDFSVWEIWGALLYGGQLVVVPFAISRAPERFLELLRQERVTVLNQTPSAFRQLIEADRRIAEGAPLALQWVIFGGEALDPRSLAPWVERHGLTAPRLVNMYGITETTVHVTLHPITASDIAIGGSVIGSPLADLSIELVDRYGQLVPIGVAGEILVGGAGLTPGYLQRPELTAERFPFLLRQPHALIPSTSEIAGSVRLYRSGDLARWRSAGGLEYLGRIDHQVKIRGFRVELGEIESVLGRHHQVREAMVEVRQEAAGPQLVAYVVSPAGYETTLIVDLRAYLKARLPDYMVPARILLLERFPLTVNGKLDRRALAGLLAQQAASGLGAPATSSSPSTALEHFLADLWCEVLGLGQIGIDDNFFELGGDSIRGAIVVNKIQERFQSVVYVVALFEAPTIRQLVTYFQVHYPEALAKFDIAAATSARHEAPLMEADLITFQRLIPPVALTPAPSPEGRGKKICNPRMVFVLSPPRSGSTLLRVLLGGHPQLFSPPELELLGFDTLSQRRQVCSGRDAFWLEGTLRAVMAALQIDADAAKQLMAQREDADLPIQSFYGELQGWLNGRILVDKSPSYALDSNILRRAEDWFDAPLYVHLHRHPYGMINSFTEAKLQQIFFRYPHKYPVRRLAELIWLHSHRNISAFLAGIPAARQMAISFADITRQPDAAVRRLCQFIGIAFDPEMLDIYSKTSQRTRMTDGIYRESRMLGDTKLLSHQRIDPRVAERWRDVYKSDFLGEPSWNMAEMLGYRRSGMMPIQQVTPRPTTWPLAFAQQRLWFLDQLEGAGVAYNMPVALQLNGILVHDALQASLRAITQRHEVLRSRVITVDDEPRVVLLDELPALVAIDLKKSEVPQWINTDAVTPFDLARGPLLRATLLRLSDSDQEHVLLVNMHHIVADGWSMGILVEELSHFYNAAVMGQAAPLPPLSIQYGDYAAWQRQTLDATSLAHQLVYWRERLAGAPALLELPTDRPRPAIQQFAGATLVFTIDATLATHCRNLAESAHVSLYMLLLGAFAVLLARYSGQADLMIGSPIANRTRGELEPLIGSFVNTLVMRLPVDLNQSFTDFLAQVRHIALEAYTHQDVPFEQLVEELKPPRNLSYSPLFQVMFSLQSKPPMLPRLTGLEVADISLRQVMAKFDLTLTITERPHELEAVLEYRTDLFDRDTMTRMAAHYCHLLQSIVTQPRHTVGQLPLLTEQERTRILCDWNATETLFFTKATTLHGLIEEQVALTPHAVAIQFGAERLTYGELDQRAQALANRLQTLGFTGGLAALFIHRSLEMVIGLLAILKAGGAYLPLDPHYPQERIRYVLDHAQVPWVLTQTELLSSLPAGNFGTLCLDSEIAVAGQGRGDDPYDNSRAYVIYTSGSTGNPKGVVIPHAAVVNFLNTMWERPGMAAHDTLLAVTTISFDIAVLELFLPLSVGARVIIADEAMTHDAQALINALQRAGVSVMQGTPATWRLLLAAGWTGKADLKILCGGEAMPSSLAAALLPMCASLWNLYGPTETTIWSTVHYVTAADLDRASIPLGKPIANTRVYVWDANEQPVPPGVTGELLIGGAGVAEGYLNRPDLTAERFLPDPLVPGARIYRTGDHARFRPDGVLEYLGRSDQQVKVRGYRVELGEIEHVLAQQPGVTACAVGLDHSRVGDARLVAYYVGSATQVAALKVAVMTRLPDYMVPSLFVALPELPLTPNGKVDRRALRVPDDFVIHAATYSAGRDNVELQLLRLWEDTLEVRPLGIHDNFFELGGHSLIAVRLIAKVTQHFGRKLALANLFQGATVAAMARLLRNDANTPLWSSLVPMQTHGHKPPIYCVAGAGGNVVYFHDLAVALGNDQPCYGLQPPGLDGVTPPLSTVEQLASHYLATIAAAGQTPHIVAGHSFGGLVAFEMARQSGTIERLILIDTPAPHFVTPTGSDWSEAQWLAQVAEIASHLYDVDLGVTLAELDILDATEQYALVHARLMAHGVLPEDTDIAYFKGFIEVYKANLRASYAPHPLLTNTHVQLIRSRDAQPDHLVAAQYQEIRATDDFGWHSYFPATVNIAVKEIPGDHLTMMHQAYVGNLAVAILSLE